MPTYFREHFNLSQGQAGFAAISYREAAMIAGVLFGGFLSDRWSRKNPRARIYVPIIGLCIAAGGMVLMANTHVLTVAVLGLVIYGFTRPFTDSNLMPILCLVCDSRYRATAYGMLNLVNCTIAGFTVYAGGLLRDAGGKLETFFMIAAGSLLVCAFLLSLIKPQTPAEQKNASI